MSIILGESKKEHIKLMTDTQLINQLIIAVTAKAQSKNSEHSHTDIQKEYRTKLDRMINLQKEEILNRIKEEE